MKLLREIGLEILRDIAQEITKILNTNPQTLRKKLVGLILAIVGTVVNISFIMISKFMEILSAVKIELYQKEERSTKKKWTKKLKQEDFNMADNNMFNFNNDELKIIKLSCDNFILMSKQGYVVTNKETIQKAQQVVDKLNKKSIPTDMLEDKKRNERRTKTQRQPLWQNR